MNSHQQIIKKINEYSINEMPFLFIVDFEMQKPVLIQTEELEKEHIRISFPQFTNVSRQLDKEKEVRLTEIIPLEKEIYQNRFERVMQHLKYGNSYLTNLTGKTEIKTDATLNEIFESAKALYKIKYKDEWVCFSPESFIKIKEGEIFSFPMKGTIDASFPNAEQVLLEDRKEIAEHYTIVDLIRNDLSIVSENVTVEKFRYVDKIRSNEKSLLQVSSKISGKLPENHQEHLGEIIFSLLPAGSVSGAPKKKTVEIIQEAENGPRGYYTGVAFYFDGKNTDSCVLIRFIEKTGNHLFYRSGGGITVNSEMEKEYQELIDKIYVPIH